MTASVIDIFRGTPAPPSPNLNVALASAAAGFPVFPCHAVAEGEFSAKSPRVAGGHRAGTTDEAAIRAWWTRWPDSLVGLGLAEAGVMAIDADRHGGPDGVAAWNELAKASGFDADAFPAVETPGQGRHVYMRRPAGMHPTNGEGDLPPGINVRGAGYTIAPGCVLPDGRRYEPAAGTPPLSLDIPEAPQWLVGMIGTARRAANTSTPACELDTAAAIERAAAYLASEAPPAIEGQGGDNTAYRVACMVKDFGISEHECLNLMLEHYQPRCASLGGADDEAAWLERKVASAYANGQNAPGSASSAVDLAGIEIIAPRYIVAPPPPPAALKWADDADSDKPIEWLLKGILPRQGVGIIYGAPKSGKSFVAFDLSARLACALPWFNVRTPKEPIGTLLLLGEGAGTVRTRLNAFRQATGAPVPPLAWVTVANLSSAAGIAAARGIIADAAAGMAQRGIRLGLIVVDTLASALGLEDENSAPEVTAALKALEALAAEFDVAVLGIHHAGKNGQDRGSSAFRAACDVMLSIERSDAVPGQPDNHRQIAVVLNRNGEGDWTANFRLDRVVLGVDEDGDEITSCAVRPAGDAPAVIDRREIVMGQFDPATIHLEGFRLPGDEWGLTRPLIARRCKDIWGTKDAATMSAVKRAVAELIQAGRLKEITEGGGKYLVAIAQPTGGDVVPASLF